MVTEWVQEVIRLRKSLWRLTPSPKNKHIFPRRVIYLIQIIFLCVAEFWRYSISPLSNIIAREASVVWKTENSLHMKQIIFQYIHVICLYLLLLAKCHLVPLYFKRWSTSLWPISQKTQPLAPKQSRWLQHTTVVKCLFAQTWQYVNRGAFRGASRQIQGVLAVASYLRHRLFL